jgi:hypothetical protein
MSTLRIVQYFDLLAMTNTAETASNLANANSTDTVTLGLDPNTVYHRYQNFFVNETKSFNGHLYGFAPFRAEGTVSNLGGDNALLQVLFPNIEIAIRLVEQGNGNRLSRLVLTTQWLNANFAPVKTYEERYIGIGAGFSDTTIELRFRSAMDSVGTRFPARVLTRNLAGLLPLSANVSLR